MKTLLTFFILVLTYNSLSAQTPPMDTPSSIEITSLKPGQVRYVGDPRIEELLATKRRINKRNEGIKGYRIQIYSGNRKQANEIKAEFIDGNDSLNAYIVYEQPYFKTRVGDFRTKIEAEKALRKLIKLYPGSFVLGDFIEPKNPL
mgnify:CR=1 FL=1|tara:strand:+ start:311 stop:748 length:438 start_codon:yes stop_codon:yes gene_type:complete